MAYGWWRIYIYASQSGSNIQLGELEFRATPGGATLCSGGTPIKSVEQAPSFTAAMAFDGSTANSWASNNTKPAWIGYQFPSAVDVQEVALISHNSFWNEGPTLVDVEASSDGVTYVKKAQAVTIAAWTAGGQTRTISIADPGTSESVGAVAQHTVLGSAPLNKESVAAVVHHTVHGASPTEEWASTVAAHSVQGGRAVALAVDMVVQHTVVAPDVWPPINPETGGIAAQRINVAMSIGRGGSAGTGGGIAQATLDAAIAGEVAAREAGDAALDTRVDALEAAGTVDLTPYRTAAAQDTIDATKASTSYVDAKVAGLSWKQAVRAATTAAGTLATSFENGDAIDGVTLQTGDRILIKDQATASENGIYVVNASGAPTRATDADVGAELVNATCYVSEGTTLADTQWTCTTNAPVTVGTTALAFAQLSSGGGLGTSSYTVFDPDKPPASANAQDDEGVGTSGSAVSGFTAANAGSSTFLYDGNGRMRLFTPSTDGDAPRFYYKAAPVGSWTITAKLTANLFSGFGTVGIAAQDSATGHLILVGLQIRNGFDLSVITQKWNSLTSFSTESQNGGFDQTVYVQLTWNGTNITTRWSRDGLHDFRTHVSADTFVAAPNRIGVEVNSNGSANSSGVFEFWRVKAATTDTVGGTRSIVLL